LRAAHFLPGQRRLRPDLLLAAGTGKDDWRGAVAVVARRPFGDIGSRGRGALPVAEVEPAAQPRQPERNRQADELRRDEPFGSDGFPVAQRGLLRLDAGISLRPARGSYTDDGKKDHQGKGEAEVNLPERPAWGFGLDRIKGEDTRDGRQGRERDGHRLSQVSEVALQQRRHLTGTLESLRRILGQQAPDEL